ncbi:unnamed protein product [Phytophthora fragariaefolia]|uniref:Unnamed protein product n=1 Tax=Phytophthora fragariaefolia TaxID=1490495 RepID=A0A9W7CLE6_9STRA|nr:unnamed protein product [Phytophthora fragariaefolia]
MLRTIFSRLGELVLHNADVERKTKLGVYNATCVHQLLALLQAEEEDDDDGVRDSALAVLNALFFDDSALYVVPHKQALRLFLAKSTASTAALADDEVTTSEQAYALKVIRNAVGTIGVNELLRSTQAQTLVMQFLAKYPGFLSEYLAALAVQLEPKPVYRWFCVASLVQKLLLCSVDAVATGLPTSKNGEALPSWCSAQVIASRLIAPGNFRKELSRSIQHSNNLVIYSALGVIEAMLKRYVRLAQSLESLGLASDVQSELRFLLPSPEALVSLLLKLCASQERSVALIYVRALTVFRLYVECLPQAMREVKVDFTKTLVWRYLDDPADNNSEESLPTPMQSMIVGEMLRFLLAVDTPRLRFLFTNGSSGNHSKLQQLLLLYVSTPSQAVQKLAGRVLQRSLLASDIFGQETQCQQKTQRSPGGRPNEEISFWLESLRQGGGKTCAEFTEQLVRAVMSDPLMYVAIGRRVVADTSPSSSLSPITVALVGFLSSNLVGNPNLSALRADPRIVAFSVRILLTLLPTSQQPRQIIALIASNDAFAVQQEENDEVPSDDSNIKKRKRSSSANESEGEDDAYFWLKVHCEALISGRPASTSVSTPKKKARAANSKWYRFSDPGALTGALVAMTPAYFTSCWEQIVSNCADIEESFIPVLHYLSARGDLDILSLLPPMMTAKAQKKQSSKSAAAEAFSRVVPAHVILQHIIFSVANEEPKKQNLAIRTVTQLVKCRIDNAALGTSDAARMCEQLLFFFSSSHPGFSESGYTQLCELLQLLLVIVIISGEDAVAEVLMRIFIKLRAVVTSTSKIVLKRRLSSVEIIALRVYSSNTPEVDLSLLCDFDSLFQRAGVPLVAVLTSSIPESVRVPVLDGLLSQSRVTTAKTRVVLIERVIKSMGGCVGGIRQPDDQYNSFSDYKRAKLLTRKLWQLLTSLSHNRQMSLFTTGFSVLNILGGIDASTAMHAIESSLVPLVVQSAVTASSNTPEVCCSEVLRSIVASIRSGNDSSKFPAMFEDQLMKRLQHENDIAVRCTLVGAIYNVFTRITSSALREFAVNMVRVCYERVLLGSQVNHTAELTLLTHTTSDNLPDVDTNDFASELIQKLARSEDEEALNSAQLIGLLLLLRTNECSQTMSMDLVLVLVRSCLFALKTADQGVSGPSHENWSIQFNATVLVLESAIGSLKRQKPAIKLSVLNAVFPLLTEARETVQASDAYFVFEAYVKLTAALLRLTGNDANAVGYDFASHLDVIVLHPCFADTLQNAVSNDVRLLLVRVVSRLISITGKFTRSLLQTLLSAYSMSLSPFDRSLRVLFDDFETQGPELTLVSMGFRFGASSTASPSADPLNSSSKGARNDLVDDSAWLLGGGLEQNRVRATIEYFPLDREVSTGGDASLLDLDEELPADEYFNTSNSILASDDEKDAKAYDPAFLLPMLSHFISSSDLPDAGIVQQGLLGIAVRATSSEVERIREFAYGILAHVHESLQATSEATSDFKAGRQVHLLLDVFRRGVEEPLEEVPSVVTVFLNDALAVLTRPTHVLYPQVNHFLLARPAMDLADVPMFYSLFNSRAPLTFRQERSWLLHTLRRGVRNDDDVALLVRRHVLPMLLSFYTSELADTHTQPLITNILLAALRTASGGVYLVTKAALMEWLAAQFLRHGAASSSMKSRNDRSVGSMRVASSALLLPLMTLLEQTLEDRVWDKLDPVQQHATALQAANAFAALQVALAGRRTGSRNDRALVTKAALVTELILRRAGSVCSLQLLNKAVGVVQLSAEFDSTNSRAFACAKIVASNIPRWLLQQRHHEAQKLRFPDWATLLRQVASILVASLSTSVSVKQDRAKLALGQLKTVLDQVPTLKHLVLSPSILGEEGLPSSTSNYAPALL